VHAFVRGFRDLIPMAWLRMFDAEELQLLIGGQMRALDVDNMQVRRLPLVDQRTMRGEVPYRTTSACSSSFSRV
jgi:hypothetical protein